MADLTETPPPTPSPPTDDGRLAVVNGASFFLTAGSHYAKELMNRALATGSLSTVIQDMQNIAHFQGGEIAGYVNAFSVQATNRIAEWKAEQEKAQRLHHPHHEKQIAMGEKRPDSQLQTHSPIPGDPNSPAVQRT